MSNAPWVPSGYGRQCQLLAGVLQTLGHDVCVSAISGLDGGPIDWQDILVLPHGRAAFGVDTVVGHAEMVNAELVITLMDFYRLWPIAHELRALNVAAWLPVDTRLLGRPDLETLRRSGARPIAMSRHGVRALEAADWGDPLYAPHMHTVTDGEYSELTEMRPRFREAGGLADTFVVGICAANNDHIRKGFPEQFEAFRRFHKTHPEARLLVHSVTPSPNGLDLEQLGRDLGLEGLVTFTDAFLQLAGGTDEDFMRAWFSSLDVLLNCSYGEGFGVPMLEAQACGTPVIATLASAMGDPGRATWLVDGEPFFNHVHREWWTKPSIGGIVRKLEAAHLHAASKREASRRASSAYLVDEHVPTWESIVKRLAPAEASEPAAEAAP